MKHAPGIVRYVLIFAGIVLVVSLGVAGLSRRGDPVVHGRRLSVSVTDLLDPYSRTHVASSNVIVALGADAVPYLAQQLKSTETSFERLATRFHLPLPAHRSVFGRQLAACRAVKILGASGVSLKQDLLPLTQSRIGSVRHAAFEALFVTSRLSEIYVLVTNAIATDRFVDCRLAATRYALAAGADARTILSLAIGNIGNGTSFKGETTRRFAKDLESASVPTNVLEEVCARFSRSDRPEVRRFVAEALPICLPASARTAELLQALMKDTNTLVAWAASNAFRQLPPSD